MRHHPVYYIALAPFTLLYAVVIHIRNFLYDTGIFRSYTFKVPLICVGNITVGGTGKTPMTEFLCELLSKEEQVPFAVLSRGYGRKTKGFREIQADDVASDTGDEPLQMKQKFPSLRFFVCEDRKKGIETILKLYPDTRFVLLDDAFQHRRVKPALAILLTDFANLYSEDQFLPWGTLRDAKRSVKRADLIIVTKCPPHLPDAEKEKIKTLLKAGINQKILFSSLHYDELYDAETGGKIPQQPEATALVFAAIARTHYLLQYLEARFKGVKLISFRDHASYSEERIAIIKNAFNALNTENKLLLTTEKDRVKLDIKSFNANFAPHRLAILPVQVRFSDEDALTLRNLLHPVIVNTKHV